MKVKGGNTTTLKDHLAGVHKTQPKLKGQGQINSYIGRKSLGEMVSFRCLAESQVIQGAFSKYRYKNDDGFPSQHKSVQTIICSHSDQIKNEFIKQLERDKLSCKRFSITGDEYSSL